MRGARVLRGMRRAGFTARLRGRGRFGRRLASAVRIDRIRQRAAREQTGHPARMFWMTAAPTVGGRRCSNGLLMAISSSKRSRVQLRYPERADGHLDRRLHSAYARKTRVCKAQV